MDLSKIVSISGQPGLFHIEAQRPDGLIVSAFGDKKKRFMSSRQHIFSPLENITIYTMEDSIELKDVLLKMKEAEKDTPVVKSKSSEDDLRKYFLKVVPDYDDEKVYVSDIRKIIKWYNALDAEKLIVAEKEKEDKKEEGDTASKSKKKAPAKKKTASKAKPSAKTKAKATNKKAPAKKPAIQRKAK